MSRGKHIDTVRKVPGFSSQSLGSSAGPERTIPRLGNSYFGFGDRSAPRSFDAVMVNRSLLEPVQIHLDPNIHAIKVQEKEQMKTLNDRFVSYIDKVRFLEQQNKMLETKLELLQGSSQTRSNIEFLFKKQISVLESQLDSLMDVSKNLKDDLERAQLMVEDNKEMYEQEINTRYTAENTYVCVKKDYDDGAIGIIKLQAKRSELRQDLDFYKALYAEELKELKQQVKDISVVVEVDNGRQLDMDHVVNEVKRQYEEVSARSRQEAEDWYKKKFELVSSQDEQRSSELRCLKNEISDLKRLIKKLEAEITSVTMECKSVEGRIVGAERDGEEAVRDAKQRRHELEVALQKAKQDMARQVREYQELLNIKLALDIEINTYKNLLEGEENRIGQESVIRVQTVPKTNYRI